MGSKVWALWEFSALELVPTVGSNIKYDAGQGKMTKYVLLYIHEARINTMFQPVRIPPSKQVKFK